MKRLIIDDKVLSKISFVDINKIPAVRANNIIATSRVKDSRQPIGLANSFIGGIDPIVNIRSTYNSLTCGGVDIGEITLGPGMTRTIPIPYIKLLKALGRCSITPSLAFSEVVNMAFMSIMKDLLESIDVGYHHEPPADVLYSPYKVNIWNAIMDLYSDIHNEHVASIS